MCVCHSHICLEMEQLISRNCISFCRIGQSCAVFCRVSASRGVFCKENEELVHCYPPPSVDGDYLLTYIQY